MALYELCFLGLLYQKRDVVLHLTIQITAGCTGFCWLYWIQALVFPCGLVLNLTWSWTLNFLWTTSSFRFPMKALHSVWCAIEAHVYATSGVSRTWQIQRWTALTLPLQLASSSHPLLSCGEWAGRHSWCFFGSRAASAPSCSPCAPLLLFLPTRTRSDAPLRVQAAALSMSSDEPNSKCTCRGCELNCRGRRRRRGYPLNLGLMKS
jgi:hypothetical protein